VLAEFDYAVAVEPDPDGDYSFDAVGDMIEAEIRRVRPRWLVVYAESMGGMVVAKMLRRHSHLNIDELVLNAAPGAAEDIRALVVARMLMWLPRHPYSTSALRAVTRAGAKRGVLPKHVRADLIEYYQAVSVRMTSRFIVSQMTEMVRFSPIRRGEFGERIGRLTYLRAPGTRDVLIRVRNGGRRWRLAVWPTPSTDRIIMAWADGQHCPTPEWPEEVLRALLDALARRA
jgi:pimeloyl-ACP methyl ester carboxylesterase